MTKVGMIGAGYVAQPHLTVLKELGVEVVAICNRGEQRRKETQEKFNIPNAYADYKEMLEKEALDAIFICASADNMASITLDCIDKGIPIFAGKPIALSLEEGEQVAAKAKEKNVPIMMGMNRRFMSTMQKAKQVIEEHGGLKGIMIDVPERITSIRDEAYYSKEIVDKWLYAGSIHCIDLFRFFGGDIESVASDGKPEAYVASIKFTSGVGGSFYSFWDTPGKWTIQLYGEKTRVTIQPLERVTVEVMGEEPIVSELSEIDKKFKPGFYEQDAYFIKNIVEKKEQIALPVSDVHDHVKTLQLIKKIEEC